MSVYKLTVAQRKFIRENVAKTRRTIVWNYLTGYTNGDRLDLNFIKSLTGMNLK